MVVVELSRDREVMRESLWYWLSALHARCPEAVVWVVGSKADGVRGEEDECMRAVLDMSGEWGRRYGGL